MSTDDEDKKEGEESEESVVETKVNYYLLRNQVRRCQLRLTELEKLVHEILDDIHRIKSDLDDLKTP